MNGSLVRDSPSIMRMHLNRSCLLLRCLHQRCLHHSHQCCHHRWLELHTTRHRTWLELRSWSLVVTWFGIAGSSPEVLCGFGPPVRLSWAPEFGPSRLSVVEPSLCTVVGPSWAPGSAPAP